MTDKMAAYDRAGVVLHGPGSEDEGTLHERITNAIASAERDAFMEGVRFTSPHWGEHTIQAAYRRWQKEGVIGDDDEQA